MSKQAQGFPIPLLDGPAGTAAQPRYLRLYRRIREGVLHGEIPAGTRLPSARTLAREEKLSRNTVEAAIRQLQAEGFVHRRVGSGTWVSDCIPERPIVPHRLRRGVTGRRRERPASGSPAHGELSARGELLGGSTEASRSPPPSGLTFEPCVPGVDALPLGNWNRLAARHTRRAEGALLIPPAPAGLPALREAITGYLNMARGVHCTADQVLVVSSTQQAIDLIARLLLDPGDAVLFEDPGYVSARLALAGAGARLIRARVDAEGFDPGSVPQGHGARLAYVTPSHQCPLGVTLSLDRRLALLAWAAESGSWIIEDDYDSELRYDGRPHPAMQGLDTADRVIYVGTFNKILFPALRVAYLVLPRALVAPFTRAREVTDGFTPPLTQEILTEFIADGHFSIHLRRVRSLYQDRRDRFLAAAARELPPSVAVGPAGGGIHVALHLPPGTDDTGIAASARRQGLALPALSRYYLGPAEPGLMVHYGHAPAQDIDRAVARLARMLNERSWTRTR